MEMQVEHNLKWEFSMTSEDGHELTPIFGPGFTGLTNLGNSCYLSSVIQCLFDQPEFQQRYYHENDEPPFTESPAEDLETQMRKLADGILSGRYSRPNLDVIVAPDSPEAPHQKGLAPAMFKHLVGRGHEEFSTMRQQDAFEFLLHLFKLVNLSRHPEGFDNPTHAFTFAMEQRLQCLCCKKVRYRVDEQDNVSIPVPARRLASPDGANSIGQFAPVTLLDCLDASTSEEKVELICPSCNSKDGFSKRSSFRTLPQQLVINARRFELINWAPTKLDIPVDVSEEPIDLSSYLSFGQKEGEELLPDIDVSARRFVPNQYALDQLLSMGFPKARCEKALYTTGNSDPEAAMNWLFAHMDDPDIDEPVVASEVMGGAASAQDDPTKVTQLVEMGIDVSRARKALGATDGDINRAIDWVFSHPEEMVETEDDNHESNARSGGCNKNQGFADSPARYELRSIVCHKGSSVHAGYVFMLKIGLYSLLILNRHYVAFVRKALPGQSGLSWVLFNDEKVVKAEDIQEMKKYAYLYFFSRV
jgi:ubiquitin carboxyl-terminal hydrolase 5/13